MNGDTMPNVLSMSLYGKSSIYLQGALANAKLMPSIYPGWKMVVYCERDADMTELESLGVEIRRRGESHQHSGMFWRFLAAWDEDAEYVIFRDADSRINVREAAAVRAWIASGCVAHCMHDHEHHRCMPIFGGMWGIKANVLPMTIRIIVLQCSHIPQKRVKDMRFLTRYVYPLIKHDTLRHSSQVLDTKNYPGWKHEQIVRCEPFPEHPAYDGFVGEQHK